QSILCRLKSAGRQQCHTELEKLLTLHTFYHDVEAALKIAEIQDDAINTFEEEVLVGMLVRGNLRKFMIDEAEIQLGNLMVNDEHVLVRKMRLRGLKTEQRIEVDIVPIGQIIRIKEPVKVARQILSHRIVLGTELL